MKSVYRLLFVCSVAMFVAGCVDGELEPIDVGTDSQATGGTTGGSTTSGPTDTGGSSGGETTGGTTSDGGTSGGSTGSGDSGMSTGGDTADGGSGTTGGTTGDGGMGNCSDGATRPCGNGSGVCQQGTETCTNGTWGSCQGSVGPSTEMCDGRDNDCDGMTDETCDCMDGEIRNCGKTTGVCQQGTQTCSGGSWGSCQGAVMGSMEMCDGRDNDCDGTVDENCNCTSGDIRDCGDSTGVCQKGTQSCVNGRWGGCQGATTGSAEMCDGKDNDCDGQVDENLTQTCGQSTGVCSQGMKTCSNGSWSSCMGDTGPSSESCDGKDNDCDGQTDENLTRSCGQSTGICSPGTETCSGGNWGSCSGQTTPDKEICDDKDNDCDGMTDEDCDKDNDDYCDEGKTVSGSPNTCGKGGGDCDDNDPDINPGASGACDGKDNDCDGQVDEVEAVVGKSQAVTHNASRSSSKGSKLKTFVATATDDGVCAAMLDSNGAIQFAHVEGDGSVTRKSHTVSGNNPTELFDIAWSGNSCALLFRRGGSLSPDDNVFLARWNPDLTSIFKKTELTTDTYNSEFEGHAAVEYIDNIGWVAAYVKTNTFSRDSIQFDTYDDYFQDGATPNKTAEITKADVAGAGPWPSIGIGESARSSDDFSVAISSRWNNQYQIRVYTVNGTSSRSVSRLRIPFAVGDYRQHVHLDEVDGDHILSYHNSNTNRRYVREIITKYQAPGLYQDYGATGSTKSGPRTQIFPTNLAAGSSSTGQWFLEPFEDEVSTVDIGSGISFTAQSHPLYTSSDDLRTLFADGSNDLTYVFSLTNKRPYKSELNAFTCY